MGLSAAVLASVPAGGAGPAESPRTGSGSDDYAAVARPLVNTYCVGCHSARKHKGGLDLERFATVEQVRREVKPWQAVAEMVEAGEMPPRDKPQPTPDERAKLVGWVKGFLAAEARARAGDPGPVPLRRLSNAEYDYTVRDLTGVDLRPAKEFPADGAAGEGFANAAEALSDVSPTLLSKYFDAAKDVSEHVVLLPDGFRFSKSKTRRDWTDEGTAALRQFYTPYANGGEGRLPVQPYLLATVRHRDALLAGGTTPAEVAAKEKLSPKYLGVLWDTLTAKTPSPPLAAIRAKWRTAAEKDVPALAADVAAWQATLWRTVKVGNYVQGTWGKEEGSSYAESVTRQVPVDPPAVESVPLRLAVKPTPGQSEAVLYLAANEPGEAGPISWRRPRFEAAGKPPLLLRDYADYGPAFEVDYPTAFANAAAYLAAVAELADDAKASADDVAKRRGLDAGFLKNWAKVVALPPRKSADDAAWRPAVALTPLEEKTPRNDQHPAVAGWRKKGTDLPVVVANSSDRTEQVPGRVSAHGVAVHPMPQEFVAVTWTSPVAGAVRVAARIAHAHPACGNGVAWWLEHRRGDRATPLGEGTVDLGKEATPAAKAVKVEKGDVLVLAVDARDANHVCDLTEVALTVTPDETPDRPWDLGADISADVQAANPHADKYGNADVWGFVRGPSKSTAPVAPVVPADSIVGRWRAAAADPNSGGVAEKLAKDAESLLSGPRPANDKSPDRALYDRLVTADGPLFTGVNAAKLAKPRATAVTFGLPKGRFASPAGDSVIAKAGEVVEIHLPAALLAGREFVVDAALDGPANDRLVRPRVATTPPGPDTRWDGPAMSTADGAGYKRLVAGNDEFRRLFPLFVCFPQVVPTDEVVTLKLFHREDEPLIRLFLDDEQARKLDRMWAEQRFVSRQPAAEFAYLPQFMGFTTQDTPKAFQQFFVDRKPLFQKHAEAFVKEEEAAIPRQLDALFDFAARAYRRPLADAERGRLRGLYDGFRGQGLPHDEAFRAVLARVLASPHFLLRIEKAPPGEKPGAVDGWELASRLSYFLWSSAPDDDLSKAAASGRLADPDVLAAQARRMLADDRVRALATEFGTQWIHVRGFDQLKEKNEQLFPTFDAGLRAAMYEESVRFFQDLFQADRPVADILASDATYLNEPLAKHYGIPGVSGENWRRVDGVKKYGRGGILGLGTVQAKQSGASRTSPVLRGNWVVETLLGEKLPRPPPDVPQLPDAAAGAGGLTVRQQVEQHAKDPACAVCHVRMDPFGFALERYDAIGRWRDKDAGGQPIDASAKLRDGTDFDGIDGLRDYLLTKKRPVFVRLFCRRLLGYALGRAVILSDEPLIDDMAAAVDRPGGKVSDAVLAVVRSRQFRMIRGQTYED